MFQRHSEKRRRWPWIVGIIMVAIVVCFVLLFQWVQRLSPEKLFQTPVVRRYVEEFVGEEHAELVDILPQLLGFSQPRTYLILFQNNTELRPGGGFIGSYGVVRATNGKFEVLDVQGTEALDRQAPPSWRIEPPKMIARELGVDRWYFRDSNWSPDFITNAKRAREFYVAEGGVAHESIKDVIVVDTTVLEELLALTGPMTIDGIEFASSTVVEKLEYDVEYGFAERGIERHERKQILRPFFVALMTQVSNDFLNHPKSYLAHIQKLVDEKHVLFFSEDASFQEKLNTLHLSGVTQSTSTDFLMWVDANLAALKTDYAIERRLAYSLRTNADQSVSATTTMTYHHTGGFDWRTTRYRTYARIYVPTGSQLQAVTVSTPRGPRTVPLADVDRGEELGRGWFGVFFVLEPGQDGSVSFYYTLSPLVLEEIKNGTYTLLVQKQIGTDAHGLTLDLDFDRTITAAKPAEPQEKWFDDRYELTTDLRIDRPIRIDLQKESLR